MVCSSALDMFGRLCPFPSKRENEDEHLPLPPQEPVLPCLSPASTSPFSGAVPSPARPCPFTCPAIHQCPRWVVLSPCSTLNAFLVSDSWFAPCLFQGVQEIPGPVDEYESPGCGAGGTIWCSGLNLLFASPLAPACPEKSLTYSICPPHAPAPSVFYTPYHHPNKMP